MDILAHGLWAAFGTALAAQRFSLSRGTVAATIALAVVPDVLHVLPVAWWGLFGSGSLEELAAYVMLTARPEPVLPPAVALWTNHLHCIMHSAVVAAAVTLAMWVAMRCLWIPLLGWWSHILIDVFTHSADFYPSPVLYPFTLRGFDGIAWNRPWLMALNYASLGVAFAWLWMRQRRAPLQKDTPRSP
jgi:hypothetical protein